jgi:hypothetical protein
MRGALMLRLHTSSWPSGLVLEARANFTPLSLHFHGHFIGPALFHDTVLIAGFNLAHAGYVRSTVTR